MPSSEQTPLLSSSRTPARGIGFGLEGAEEQAAGQTGPQDGRTSRSNHIPLECKDIPPQICSKVVSRLKAMVLRLLPLQVDSDDITASNGSIITATAVEAFALAGGDFGDCVPYCLLVARHSFHKDAYRNPSDYDEHMNHKLACEVLARRVVSLHIKPRRQHVVLSTRFSHIESDGDVSLPLSAIELASDQHCPIFLSSAESQKTVFALWKGHLVQGRDAKGHVVYELWKRRSGLDPSRLAVPRYQNILRVALWIIFLVCYTLAIQTPDREFGLEDYIFYIQVLGYTIEEIVKIIKVRSIAALTFWTCVSFMIYALSFVALGYRIADAATHDNKAAQHYRLRSFQILSCAAPLVWAKILTVFSTFYFFGSMQIVIARMLKESAVFFTLLLILSMGFLQALTGLDVADNTRDATSKIVHSLLQGLLGSPDFDSYMENASYPYGMILYYGWTILTIIILLNFLIAQFSSSYEAVTDDAIAQYMAFFSQKTIAGVRAPDQFVYVAPFNLIEILILPLELCLSVGAYSKLNNVLMEIIFLPILCVITLFEAHYEKDFAKRSHSEPSLDEDGLDYSFDEDPDMSQISGLNTQQVTGEISKIKFEDLVKSFPDLQTSTSSQILSEVRSLKTELDALKRQVRESSVGPASKEIKKEEED